MNEASLFYRIMSFQGDSIYWVEVEKIVPNPFQPRREFDEAKLKELSESIRMYGILQPLTVTKKEVEREDGAFYSEYELIAGERRLRAARLAGMDQVPVIIRMGQDTEQEKLELAIIENLQREDLNAIDRALAFRQLADVFDLAHSAVAKKVGRSREYVTNTIRLLNLPDYMQSSLRTGDISEGHARSLLMLKDKPEEQDVVFREILLKRLSVREVERIARKIATDKVRKKNWINTDPVLIEIEREFTDTLGTRVQISKTDFGGKLTIDYFSDEDLQKLLAIVKSQGKITDFHLAGNEESADDAYEALQKLSNATVLEVVDEQSPTIEHIQETPHQEPEAPLPIAEEAIESEEAVSEVIEEVVVEKAQYAAAAHSENGSIPELRQTLEMSEPGSSNDVVDRNKVPPSNYVAQERQVEPEHNYFTAPAPSPTQETKKDDDDDLYSIRNFNL
jgi:ParB family chromosome partitioning protein